MSELISGKEALIALANGEEVEIESNKQWVSVENCSVYQFLNGNHNYKFRLKPRTITINGIKVPAPFEPKEDCTVFIIDDGKTCNYRPYDYEFGAEDDSSWIGIWRTEDEIKKVIVALRQVFGDQS